MPANRAEVSNNLQLLTAASVLCLLIAVLVGLPVAVDLRTTLDTLHGGERPVPVGAVMITEPVELLPLMGLTVERATLTGLGSPGYSDPQARNLVLDAADIRLNAFMPLAARASPAAISAPSASLPGAPLLQRLATGDMDSLLLRRTRLILPRSNGDPTVLTNVVAEVKPGSRGAASIKGLATYNGRRMEFLVNWQAPDGATVPFALRVDAGLFQAKLVGALQNDGTLKFRGTGRLEAPKLRTLARWLALPVEPGTDLRNSRIVGAAEWSEGAISFANAVVSLDGNTGSGALTLRAGATRPSIEGTLGFDRFDVSGYLASMMAEHQSGTAAQLPQQVRSLLSAVDADLRLSAGKLVAPGGVETGRAALTLTLQHGRLQADLAELEIERGKAVGQITVDVSGDLARVALRGKLNGIDPGRVFTEPLKRNPLFGRANVALEASGIGRSLPAILTSMTGKGAFSLMDGGRLGLDLKTLAYAAQLSPIVGWSAAGKGTTSLDVLDGRFTIANRGISVESLSARSGAATYAGGGKIDLAEHLVDLILTLPSGTGDPKTTPREALVLRGSWRDPAISLLRQPLPPAASAGEPAAAAVPALQVRN
jgi:hypothetical protein